MANASHLRVFLAGRVAIEAKHRVIDEGRFPGRQGRLLFAYLVDAQGRPVPRDELAEVLWEESPPTTWEKSLTVIASKVRSLLADGGVDGTTALTSAFGCYRLELPEGTWVDVIAAEDAAQQAEDALSTTDLDRAKAEGMLAASLVERPFLPGDDGAWVAEKRRELADVRVRALSVLADGCLRSDDPLEAVKWAEQLTVLEPFRETGYRRLMEAHVAAGNRAEHSGSTSGAGGSSRMSSAPTLHPRPRRSTAACSRRRRPAAGAQPRPKRAVLLERAPGSVWALPPRWCS